MAKTMKNGEMEFSTGMKFPGPEKKGELPGNSTLNKE